jgi:hypothetical protein
MICWSQTSAGSGPEVAHFGPLLGRPYFGPLPVHFGPLQCHTAYPVLQVSPIRLLPTQRRVSAVHTGSILDTHAGCALQRLYLSVVTLSVGESQEWK